MSLLPPNRPQQPAENSGVPLDVYAIAERAAHLEYENGLPKQEAEAQAVGEALDRLPGDIAPDGILGELVRALRLVARSDVQPVLLALGLVGRRGPAWGVAPVVADRGGDYRPAEGHEPAKWALIVPAFDDGGLGDLVAESVETGRIARRLGVAPVLGGDAIDRARDSDQPLLVFDRPSTWLRGHCLGSVVLDWGSGGQELEGVRRLLCRSSLAGRLHEITRRCWPRPIIAVPSGSGELRNAA